MECPVEGCPGVASSWIFLRVHFVHLHMQDTKVVLEEGNCPLPWYPQCDMFVSWESLNETHLAREVYVKGVERKRRRLLEEEVHMRTA